MPLFPAQGLLCLYRVPPRLFLLFTSQLPASFQTIFLALVRWYLSGTDIHVFGIVPETTSKELRASTGVLPDAGTHVSGAGGEVVSCRARGHGDNAVLVSLKHHLGVSGPWVPELHTPVLRSRHDPLVIRCQSNGQNEILETKRVRSQLKTAQKLDYLPGGLRKS